MTPLVLATEPDERPVVVAEVKELIRGYLAHLAQ